MKISCIYLNAASWNMDRNMLVYFKENYLKSTFFPRFHPANPSVQFRPLPTMNTQRILLSYSHTAPSFRSKKERNVVNFSEISRNIECNLNFYKNIWMVGLSDFFKQIQLLDTWRNLLLMV